MDVTPLIKQGSQVIQSYAAGSFRVSGEMYSSSVIVYSTNVVLWNIEATSIAELSLDAFGDLITQADDIDIVLLGCGAKMEFMNPALKNSLKDKGLSIDVMNTGAACRTYNVLMAEGRRVVAALLPV